MKDKEARKTLEKHRRDIEQLEIELREHIQGDSGIFVKFCKKCKHDTTQAIDREHLGFGVFINRDHCLNCGTLWDCHKETVCKEVKERR